MASRFWVGGTGNWDGSDTSHWAATSGGSTGASVPTSSDDVTFDSNSGASATVTVQTAGANANTVTINKSDINVTLSASLTVVGAVTFTLGTFNTNGQICSFGYFEAISSGTRTLTLGASTITCTSRSGTSFSGWNSTGTNITVNANTSSIVLTGSGAGFQGTQTYNDIKLTGPGNQDIQGNITCATFTRTGTATTTDGSRLFGNLTVSGLLTMTGNSVTNRLFMASGTVGTTRTMSAGSVSLTNIDFQDMTAAGAAIPFTGTSMGNALGNTNITFDTPVTRYGVAAGNWSSTSMWSTSSGGSAGASVPLPQDAVILDANSGAGTYTANMPRMGANITCTGFTRTLSFASVANIIFGSITLGSGMTVSGTQITTLSGRSSLTITSAGKTFAQAITFNAPGATYTLQDNFACGNFTVTLGTFTANNFNVTVNATLYSNGTTINMGSGTWSLISTAVINIWFASGATTINASTSTIVIANASTNIRTFTGGGKTYNVLSYTVANSPGSLTITGANTFDTLNIGSGRIVTMPSSTTNTFNNFNVNGVNNGYIYNPGVASYSITTPHLAAHSWTATSTAEFFFDLAFANWSSIPGILLCKESSDPGRYWKFGVQAGAPFITWYPTGNVASAVTAIATTTVPFGLSQRGKIKVVVLLNDGASGRRVQFYTSTDYDIDAGTGTWTQLGSDVTGASSALGGTGSVTVNFGSLTTTLSNMTGLMYRERLKVDSTVVFDTNFATKTVGANTFTESSSNAATVTIAGDLIQVGDGRVSLVSSTPSTAATLSKSSGIVSCDYLSIQDSTATGGAGWYAGANSRSISNNTGWIFTAPPSGNMLLVF